MVRNIVVLSGNSHPSLVESICNILSVPPCNRILTKFSGGESRCEIQDSVRGKDVYIVQSGGGAVNDHFIELCIMISACKMGSAKRVTAVLPLFPYSRQPDAPYNKSGAPLSKPKEHKSKEKYTFESVPATPGPGMPKSVGLSAGSDLVREPFFEKGPTSAPAGHSKAGSVSSQTGSTTVDRDYRSSMSMGSDFGGLQAKKGYKQWVAQAGNLIADLLTCAGADHVVTLELHDPQYQGFFDSPVDNLYARPLLKRYIQQIPGYKEAVIVSPDAGGTKRASGIADDLGMDIALIHKERRPTKITDRQNATMMLVGDVFGRVCILVDDLLDTGNTITRAAKLLQREGAQEVYALVTHGVFSGDAIARVNASTLYKVIVTNSVPQDLHQEMCPKLEVLDVSSIFSEAIRRIHHGESLSVLFQHD
ncbi:ribose-phosphate pyrophosphokinase [Coniochaeta pulveracea]|uniref:Ribose-phosphate pyrophosphokinase n=1 Tax=Coniochaeta pulveracea TaxID=177199 RepID=A0A420Y2V5_9PEZI|nr:ribose-phosphate pyrophosphokinase [Coniochaeta pulveracea]